MRITRTLAVLFALLAGSAISGAAHGEAQGSCERGLVCRTVAVPLDYDAPAGPRLLLDVATLPGTREGAFLLLTGGPGQAGIATVGGGEAMRELRRLSGGRTVVSVDQRGTGNTALRCDVPDPTDPLARIDAGSAAGQAALCARGVGPSRVDYTTGDTIEDLEAVRAQLGLERWSVGGISYGTLVASSYARRHPDRVERLLLDSTLRLDGSSAVDLDTFAAARRIVGGLCAGGACPGVGRLATATAQLARRLERRAIPGVLVDSRGRAARHPFGGPREAGALLGALQAGDLSPAARAAFPAGVRAALRGDASLLNRIVADQGSDDDPRTFSIALLLATTCEDTRLPWSGSDAVASRRKLLRAWMDAIPASALAPYGPAAALTSGIAPFCLGWPEVNLWQPPAGGIPESIPTLVLSGADDTRTPTESARSVVAASPGAQLLVVPHRGHSVLLGGERCVQTSVRRFFAQAAVQTRACRALGREIDPYPVPPVRLSELPPAVGYGGRIGRTLTAIVRTLDDIDPSVELWGDDSDTTLRAPGLRSGVALVSLRGQSARVMLRGFSYVPGVTVTGELGRGALRIAGARAARGTLSIESGGVLTGVLDGRRVAVRIVGNGARRVPLPS